MPSLLFNQASNRVMFYHMYKDEKFANSQLLLTVWDKRNSYAVEGNIVYYIYFIGTFTISNKLRILLPVQQFHV